MRYYYPLEFIAAALNVWQDKQEKTGEIIKYANKKGIKILPSRFRYSRSEYYMDRSTNGVYKGMKSIKYMNEASSNELYALRSNEYSTFTDLLYDIFEKTSIDARQLEILIKLDFFVEFGNSKELMRIFGTFAAYKNGHAASLKKEKIGNDEILLSIIKRNSTETEKTFKNLQTPQILRELEFLIKSYDIEDFSIKEKIEFSKDYLGYIGIQDGKPESKMNVVVLKQKNIVSTWGKTAGQIWKVALKCQSIGTGMSNNISIDYDLFKNEPFGEGDTIHIDKCGKDKNGYWNIYAYHRIF